MNKIRIILAFLLLGAFVAQAQPASYVDYTEHGKVLRNVNYEALFQMQHHMDVYLTDQATQAPVVILLHGGSYIKGNRQDLKHVAEDLMADGFNAVLIDYAQLSRRYAGVDRAANINDMLLNVWHAIQFLQMKSADWNIPPGNYHLLGEECGGHLALLAAYKFKEQIESVAVVGAITDLRDVETFTNLTGSTYRTKTLFSKLMGNVSSNSKTELPVEYINASPVYQVREVPTLLIHGRGDRLVPVEQAIKMERALNEYNVHPSSVVILEDASSNLIFDEDYYPTVYRTITDFFRK